MPTANPIATHSLTVCACFNARTAARRITTLYDSHMAPCGLRTSQFAILVAVSQADGPTMQDVAAELGVDPSTMTRTLAALVKAGLVSSEHGADRRRKQLSVTGVGRQRMREAGRLWESAQDELRDKLGPARFDRIIEDLALVDRALD